MNKAPQLPVLPGFNFDNNVGRTRFHRCQLFDKIHEGVYYLAEKSETSQHSRYPAIYAWGEVPPRPPWLSLDRQRLKFYAYFQESVHGAREPYRIRLVDISFFLEDGTMKISEPAIDNSGLEQGVLVRRQRIPLPDPVKYRYFDILDLNIGLEPRIFGCVYKVIDCDKFTRHFLNRMGIPVPDPLPAPANPAYEKKWATEKHYQKKPNKLKNFLKYDRKVLRFYGFWDDRESSYGYIHELEILYYLSDETMEIFEFLPVTNGPPRKALLVKRMKVPKFFENLEPIGSEDPVTLLNVLGENTEKGYYVADNTFSNRSNDDCYKESQLTIGSQISIFGRKVVITDVDQFTRDYYRNKYGLDDFTPLDRPEIRKAEEKDYRYIPPYNGYGSYEDSLANCFSAVPKRPKVLTDKLFTYENQANDTRILRFGSKMISDIPTNQGRHFVLNVFLIDETIAITEVGTSKKSGQLFQKRMRILLPDYEIFSSEQPKCYNSQDFYIGVRLNLHGFIFEVETVDEYTFNYMERHCDEYPKANVKFIMTRVRDSLKSVYREFLSKYAPTCSDSKDQPILRLSCLREALKNYLGDQITEHEILTVARHYALQERGSTNYRDFIRAMVHSELLRDVWNELDRLAEEIHSVDRNRTGYVDRDQLYTVLRACRIPLSRDLINLMLNYLRKNEEGKVDCCDLLNFVNIKVDPLPPLVPMPIKELYWALEDKPRDCKEIDWSAFLKDLNLESELTEVKTSNDKE